MSKNAASTIKPLFWVLILAVALCNTIGLSAQTEPDGGGGGDEPVEEEGDTFDSLTAEAAELYGEKRYKEAAEKFIQAYEMNPEVYNHLYNIGVVLEKAGDFERSVQYYQKFVVAPDIDSEARQDALKRMKALQEIIAMQKGPEDKDPKDGVGDGDKKKDDEKKVELPPPPPPEPDYTLAYIFLGTGAAALIGGGVSAILASNAHTEAFETASSLEARRDAIDSGETLALTADILFGVGGALAVTSIILFAVEASSTPEQPKAGSVSVAPVFAPNGAGLQLSMPF